MASRSMNDMCGIERDHASKLWNPVGVRTVIAIATQRALRDAGLWNVTPSAYK